LAGVKLDGATGSVTAAYAEREYRGGQNLVEVIGTLDKKKPRIAPGLLFNSDKTFTTRSVSRLQPEDLSVP
jgi:hypothetical protein